MLLLLSPNMNKIANVSRQLEKHYRLRWGESRHTNRNTDVHREPRGNLQSGVWNEQKSQGKNAA